MTLGRRSEHREQLAEVERYAFKRAYFPWSYNEHSVVLVQNDGYIADDDRLFLHLSLACELCGQESVKRGKLCMDGSLHDRAQTVKMLALFPYHKQECKP